MERIITSTDIVDFLNDVAQNSVTTILEGKEANELIDIAKKSGIRLQGNSDLAGFKNVYAVTDKANKNKCRLPHEIVEKSLDSLNGKPVDIDHIRKYVVGHYLKGKLDGKNIITYGLFYKSNFGDEYEEAKKLFKAGKLTTSFEIHCPPEDREYHEDGTYSLKKMEFAGGGILFKTIPAYPEAKVLELAKKRMDDTNRISKDLIYASEDLITSNIENAGFKCSCIKCGYEMTLKDGEHCADKKCPDCGGQMRRADHPGPGRAIEEIIEKSALPKEVTTCVKKKIKDGVKITDAVKQCWVEYKKKTAANVDILLYEIEDKGQAEIEKKVEDKMDRPIDVSLNVFDLDLVTRMVSGIKCPNQEEGESHFLYLVGIDFEQKKAFLRCDIDKKKYSVNLVLKPKEVASVELADEELIADVEDLEKFERDLISAVEGEVEEAARLTTEQRNALPDSSFAVVVTVKKKRGEGTRKIRMFPIHDAAHVRNALARLAQVKVKATLKSLGVSVKSVEKKILARAKKLGLKDLLERRKANLDEEGGNKIMDEKTKKELAEKIKKLGLPEDATKEQIEAKEKEVADKAKAEKEKADKAKAEKAKADKAKAEKDKVDKEKVDKDKDAKIKDLETKVTALEKSLKEIDVEKIKADAVKVSKLREELGKDAEDVKDEDLLDEKKLADIKLKKENKDLKAKVKILNGKIEEAGIKEPDESGHEEDIEESSKETKKIDKSAYGNPD